MESLIVEVKTADGQVLGVLMANAVDFSTGSRGFRAMGKIFLDGKKHQVNCNLVEIGSKPVDLKEPVKRKS